MTDFDLLLRVLKEAGVDFIIVGGVAAVAHGSARLTQVLDVVYSRDDVNIRCLAEALAGHSPYLRGAPDGLPFRWDTETIHRGLNFTLTTDLGDLDLLGEIGRPPLFVPVCMLVNRRLFVLTLLHIARIDT